MTYQGGRRVKLSAIEILTIAMVLVASFQGFSMNIINLIWILSIIMLTRTVLIILGYLKSPILRQFERYGDEEYFIQMVMPFSGWAGIFMIASNLLLAKYWNYDMFLMGIGLTCLVVALVAHERPDLIGNRYGLIFNNPRWLHELSERTTRLERRRIAYMWIRLPRKLRLIYNSNDRAFLEWADMVILGTLA